MRTLILAIDLMLEIYIFVLLAVVILAWLISFRVIPSDGRGTAPAQVFLRRVTDPVLRPIRFVLSRLTAIDVSPVIMIIIIMAVRYTLAIYALPNVSTRVLLNQFWPKSWSVTKLEELPPLPDKRFFWLGIAGITAQPVASIPGVTPGLPALRLTALQGGVHTVAWRVTGFSKNERYRITAWVRPLAGANFAIAARDQADLENGPYNARAYFDLASRKVIRIVGNGKPGIEEAGDWLTVWLDLLTTDGQYVVNVYVCKGGAEIYAADGQLGVILGGISAD